MHGAVDKEKSADEHRENQRIHRPHIVQIEHAEELPARHRLDAILAPRERRLQIEEVHHLRERERDHREVDPLPPSREEPGNEAEQFGTRRAADDLELWWENPY